MERSISSQPTYERVGERGGIREKQLKQERKEIHIYSSSRNRTGILRKLFVGEDMCVDCICSGLGVCFRFESRI